MDERELIAHFIEQARRGYTMSEIIRDLIVRGVDRELVQRVAQMFIEDEKTTRTGRGHRLAIVAACVILAMAALGAAVYFFAPAGI